MSLVPHQAAFLLNVCKLIQFATDQGWTVTGGELWRTSDQQAIYLRAGKTKTMMSNHLRRLAVDLNFLKEGKPCWDQKLLSPLGDYWQSLHPLNRWGGYFKSLPDVPHFERNAP